MEQPVAVTEPQPMTLAPVMQVAQLKQQRQAVMQVMQDLMQEGVHYGKIPNVDKPFLYKAGAEMLGMTFGLRATFTSHPRELEGGHREYLVECTLTYRDGSVLATAEGLCSTMESKYRYRYSQRKCPECRSEKIKKSKHSDGYYCYGKIGGCGANFKSSDRRITGQKLGKVENPEIADQMNTVLKMASKRSHVACIRLALAVSDMFEVEEDARRDRAERDEQDEQDEQQDDPGPTPHQEVAHECAHLATKLNRNKASIAELLQDGGVPAPKGKWTDLSIEDLRKARKILEDELKLIEGGE